MKTAGRPLHATFRCAALVAFVISTWPALAGSTQDLSPHRRASAMLAEKVTAFVDVTVVPMDGRATLAGHTVIVRGRRIEAVGPSDRVEIPSGAVRIEGRGRWLSPGLVDSHVHLFSRSDLDLYLANGVTTIVNLGGYGAADSILEIRRAVRSGELRGPTIYTSGNWLDGDPPLRSINTVIRTPEEGRAEVRRQRRLGYDFIKLYEQLAPEVYDAIVAEAQRVGIPTTGHVPNAVGVDAVLRSGQRGIEHASGIVFGELGFRGDDAAIERLARKVQRSNVAVTSILWMNELAFTQRRGPAGIDAIVRRPEMRFLPAERRAAWRDQNMFARFPVVPLEEGEARVDLAARFIAALIRSGAVVLAGTDADVAGSVPGFAIHEELRMLSETGLASFDVLRVATAAPGAYLASVVRDAEVFGRVEAGARADLLLLAADPLDDLATLRRPVGVMAAGSWYTAADLKTMLDAAAPVANDHPGLAALRASWIDAYEASDTAGMADLYVADAVRMPYDAPAVEGRDAILAAYGVQFESRQLYPRIDLIPESVLVVGAIAIERGRYDETLTSRDKSVRIREIGKYVSVARLGDDGRWRFATSIFNRDAPP